MTKYEFESVRFPASERLKIKVLKKKQGKFKAIFAIMVLQKGPNKVIIDK